MSGESRSLVRCGCAGRSIDDRGLCTRHCRVHFDVGLCSARLIARSYDDALALLISHLLLLRLRRVVQRQCARRGGVVSRVVRVHVAQH
jgi:hypothetical protein